MPEIIFSFVSEKRNNYFEKPLEELAQSSAFLEIMNSERLQKVNQKGFPWCNTSQKTVCKVLINFSDEKVLKTLFSKPLNKFLGKLSNNKLRTTFHNCPLKKPFGCLNARSI